MVSGQGAKQRKPSNDPLSHRIIEKRRRDRMNNCLADLSRLIPPNYLKKGRGRIEKTEIIEMAIKHMKHLQGHTCQSKDQCDVLADIEAGVDRSNNSMESFRVGYHECLTEMMHFLVEKEGYYSGDTLCVRLMGHLQKHYDKLGRSSMSTSQSSARDWSVPLGSEQAHNPGGRKRSISEVGVKSEFGVASEESGYVSVKADCEEDNVDTVGWLKRGPLEEMQQARNEEEEEEEEEGTGIEEAEYKMESGGGAAAVAGGPAETVTGSLYKFKSNIRQRFSMQDGEQAAKGSADKRRRTDGGGKGEDDDREQVDGGHAKDQQEPPLSPAAGPGRADCEGRRHQQRPEPKPQQHPEGRPPAHYGRQMGFGAAENGAEFAGYPEIKSSPSPGPYFGPAAGHTEAAAAAAGGGKPRGQQPSIPIFALSSSGSFYVPLTVDCSVISPYMSLFSEDASALLHPVTISVNFNGPVQAALSVLQQQGQGWRDGGDRSSREGVIIHHHQQQPSVIKRWREQAAGGWDGRAQELQHLDPRSESLAK